ncbi:protein ABCI12, chloroplastic isoform X1 [Beta vulgaris subsp. vulgaris]|uniref:protein ABCI12, chloroplastic isoform X1 n=1 Tax=Beta vulgaris subsp. vulgaris TaxID=3555 RepID=UPI0020375D6B|nr:protein ABCI12, chloroplastic isoform X1 [Beta vulgaris subsp. vulgaris]
MMALSHPTIILLSGPKSFIFLPSSTLKPWKMHLKTLKIHCSAASSNGEVHDWRKWVPKKLNFGPDKVLQSIAGATSSPICQYISSPPTVLHSVDPRIKLVWLLVLVFLPARSNIYMRFGIVFSLALLSTWILPADVCKDQLGRVALLSLILFIVLGLTADGVLPSVSRRTPPPSLSGLPSIPSSVKGYTYMLFKFGPLQMTRKGLSVASTSACLTFTILQSASLCLSTTPPEQLASGLRWFLLPFAPIGVPVDEIVLTLMLSLRFINLIFDEVRNVALGILSRRIHWQDLTLLEKIDVFVMYIRRIFKNIFSHAEQISQAMIVRGFRGDSNCHKIHFQPSSITMANVISLLALCGVIGATRLSGSMLV